MSEETPYPLINFIAGNLPLIFVVTLFLGGMMILARTFCTFDRPPAPQPDPQASPRGEYRIEQCKKCKANLVFYHDDSIEHHLAVKCPEASAKVPSTQF